MGTSQENFSAIISAHKKEKILMNIFCWHAEKFIGILFFAVGGVIYNFDFLSEL
jgi:hypothetical protein